MKIFLTLILCSLIIIAKGQNAQPKETTVFYNSLNWSPDGTTLCFSVIVLNNGVFDNKHWEIGAINVQTKKVKRVTNNMADENWPVYSPDGKKLAFQSDRDGNSQIYVSDFDGKHPLRVSNNKFTEYQPDWSPDGKKIVFVSDRDGNSEIYKMNADGSEQTRLTTSPYKEFNPQWSPDGQKILYYYEKGDNKDQIYITDKDGKNSIKLTSDSTHNYFPSWSPGGQGVLYATAGGMWQMKVNDPAEKKSLLQAVSFAKYSPDGKKIAFRKGRWPSAEIWICDSDGNNPVQLTDTQKMIRLFTVGTK